MTEADQKVIFEDWLTRYRALIFKVVRGFGRTAHDREDIFQEIAIQVWHSVPSFQHRCAITSWIYRIALNTAISWLRREGKHEKSESLDKKDILLNEQTPDDERLSWLYGEIQKMDEIDRSLCLLLLDGFSYKEMSEVLGITTSNVGVKINRIKKLLAEKSKIYEYEI
jgi:RNA polymerase sigma-70 factor, ECF subfamily